MCGDPAPAVALTREQITSLRRESLGVSQRLFAGILNVAEQTVHAWEQGGRNPTGSALRLLQVAQVQPSILVSLIPNGASGNRLVKSTGKRRKA
jgi:putative transcriptional regulator